MKKFIIIIKTKKSTKQKKIASDPFFSKKIKNKSTNVKTAPVMDDDKIIFVMKSSTKPPFISTEKAVITYKIIFKMKKIILITFFRFIAIPKKTLIKMVDIIIRYCGCEAKETKEVGRKSKV